MFGSISLLWRLVGLAAIIAVLVGSLTVGYFAWRHSQRMVGWNQALEEVASQNNVAKRVADKVARDVDTCHDNGGNWNVSTGDCDL